MIATCHVVDVPKLTLANSKLIILTSLIQKQRVLKSPVYLTLPISVPQSFPENMKTKHTCPLGLATTLTVSCHVTGGLVVLKRAEDPLCGSVCPSLALSFTCSFKSSYSNLL